ncbi:MAG: hypothetical protein ACXABY_25500, partial [Candidatus Thorarchaeota archaeon]
MNQTFDWALNLWNQFLEMSTEWKVIVGLGIFAALSAVRTVWKLSYPVRWAAGSLLSIASWAVKPGKRRMTRIAPKLSRGERKDAKRVEGISQRLSTLPSSCNTLKRAVDTVHFWSKPRNLPHITTEGLKHVINCIDSYQQADLLSERENNDCHVLQKELQRRQVEEHCRNFKGLPIQEPTQETKGEDYVKPILLGVGNHYHRRPVKGEVHESFTYAQLVARTLVEGGLDPVYATDTAYK